MMAAHTNKSAWVIVTFVLLSLRVSEAFSSPCIDGTYEHEGRVCCLCGLGLQVVKHCVTNLNNGECKPCDPETYSSQPNDRTFCEPCTSCSHRSENLEVDEPCTPARDAKCRCQKGHYCSSRTDICKLCQPCKECGAEGIKAACTGNNNTVCNDKIEGGNQVGIILGTISAIAVIAVAGGAVFFWRKRQRTPGPVPNGIAEDVELQNLRVPDVDLQPYLPDIAKILGWTVMKEVAIRSGIQNSAIDSCVRNNPSDNQEQTLELLGIWVENEGMEASKNLIQILQKSGKKGKAEKVAARLNLPA